MSINALLPEEEDKVKQICRQVLRKDWDKFPISINLVGGTNFGRLCLCSIADEAKGSIDEAPRKVLVRLNPGVNDLCVLGEAGEDLVYYIFSETKLGPKLHGVVPGARVEQFVPSRLLIMKDYENLDLYSALAEKVAQIHSLDVPIKRDPQVYFQHLHLLTERALKMKINMELFEGSMKEKVEDILGMDIKAELNWIEELVPKVKTRIVFGHNDIHTNNVLLQTSNEKGSFRDNLKIIDVETSCYFYRGLEFGTHFLMSQMEMSSDGRHKFLDPPTDERKRFFVGAYLKEWRKLNPLTFDPELDTVDNILFESDFFSMVRYILMTNVFKEWIVTGGTHIPLRILVETFYGLKESYDRVKKEAIATLTMKSLSLLNNLKIN